MTSQRCSVTTASAVAAIVLSCITSAWAAPQKVAIKAYINVSSRCQDDTVKFLQGLVVKHKDVSLSIVDFGAPEGRGEWEKSGYGCMTILVNGHHTVTIGKPGQRRVVSFLKPAGFLWSHDDLRRAVEEGLKGTLYLGEEKGAEKTLAAPVKADVTARRVRKKDDGLADVLVNDTPVFRLAASQGKHNAFRRAELVAADLQELFDKGFDPTALRMGDNKGSPCIMVGDARLVTAYPDDAKYAKVKPERLLTQWAGNLMQAIITARRGD